MRYFVGITPDGTVVTFQKKWAKAPANGWNAYATVLGPFTLKEAADVEREAKIAVELAPSRLTIVDLPTKVTSAMRKAGLLKRHEQFVRDWIESDKEPTAMAVKHAVATGTGEWARYAQVARQISQQLVPWTSRTLYRGISGKQAAEILAGGNTLHTSILASWSGYETGARRYVTPPGVIVTATIQRSDVFMSHELFGDLAGDEEYIVVGTSWPIRTKKSIPNDDDWFD